MTNVFEPLPRGLRLRAVQPLTGRDGSCSLIYDLERGRLVEVPVEFNFHAAMALDTGNLDEDLIAWLAGEDVLTYESRSAGSAAAGAWAAPAGEESEGPLARLDRVFFHEDEVHCRLGGLDAESAVATVDSLLQRSGDARVVFHLAAEQEQGFSALEPVARRIRAAREAGDDGPATPAVRRRLAAPGLAGGRRVDLELITDGCGLTPQRVRFLAEHDVLVRLTQPELPAMDLLLTALPERLTLSIRLDTGDRLLDLWQEAKALGVLHVEGVKITDKPFAGLALHESEVRQFRRDLFAVSDDMFAQLEAGRQPRPLYEPLARVVGRHMAGRIRDDGERLPGYLGVVSHGELFPFFARPGFEAGDLPDDAEPLPGTSACASCWGRELCVRGSLAGPAADPHRPMPRADRCEFWRTEVEVGLLFFHRLQATDPSHLLGFAEGREEPVLDPYAHLGVQEAFKN